MIAGLLPRTCEGGGRSRNVIHMSLTGESRWQDRIPQVPAAVYFVSTLAFWV